MPSTSKTIIFSAPQGWGKTSRAPALCQELGCKGFVDEWQPAHPVRKGALHLTNVPPDALPNLAGVTIVSRGWPRTD